MGLLERAVVALLILPTGVVWGQGAAPAGWKEELTAAVAAPPGAPTAKPAPAYLTVTASVDGVEGRACRAYLSFPSGKDRLPVVLDLEGTGLYTMSVGVLDPAVEEALVRRRSVAVVAFDKPGLEPDPESRVRVDMTVYARHTQADLAACAANALSWAAARRETDPDKGIFLRGHSEGALVAVRVYKRLLESGSPAAGRIKALLLSGLPMRRWADILALQNRAFYPKGLAELAEARERDAIDRGDDVFLLMKCELPAAYLRHALLQESLAETLEGLAPLRPPARFLFFQGREDSNVQASAVEAFERSNAERGRQGRPALDLSVRYYDAGHSLNEAAVKDLSSFLP